MREDRIRREKQLTNFFTLYFRFLQDSQSQLTSIQLNCCPFVNSETLRLLATYCQDLRGNRKKKYNFKCR